MCTHLVIELSIEVALSKDRECPVEQPPHHVHRNHSSREVDYIRPRHGWRNHSSRSATMGSIRKPRYAGTRQAIMDTTTIISSMAVSTPGSVVEIPKS